MRKKKVMYRPKSNKRNPFVYFLAVAGVVVVASAAVAGIWQMLDPVEYEEPPIIPNNLSVVLNEDRVGSVTDKFENTDLVGSTSMEEHLGDVTGDVASGDVVEEPAPPANEWVSSSYFDDAVFIGDSITEGIKAYNIMSNTTVLSYTGINLSNIGSREVITLDSGEKVTIMDAASRLEANKIYILMGANSMFMEKEKFVTSYKKVVDELVEMHPEATIYVQSILPVTQAYEDNRPEFANSIIDDYNAGLKEMCDGESYHYLNVAEVFKDETGALPDIASPKDGMHFTTSWYNIWFDYLRENTI